MRGDKFAGFTAQEAYSTKREALPQMMHDLLTARMTSLRSISKLSAMSCRICSAISSVRSPSMV